MEKLLKRLLDNGYDAEITTVNKVNVGEVKALVIRKGNIGKCYYDVTEDSYDEVVKSFKDACDDENDIINKIKNKENLRICIRKPADDDIISRKFMDLELYVRVYIESGSVSITNKNINILEVSEDELFCIAMENSRKLCSNVSMMEEIGMPECKDSTDMRVLKTNGGFLGASVMCFVSEMIDYDAFIIPSSVHEVLCIPYNSELSIEELNNTVMSVNGVIDKSDILSDHVYLYKDGKLM